MWQFYDERLFLLEHSILDEEMVVQVGVRVDDVCRELVYQETSTCVGQLLGQTFLQKVSPLFELDVFDERRLVLFIGSRLHPVPQS